MKRQGVTYEIALALKELDFNIISRFGNETSLYNKNGRHVFYTNYGFMYNGLNDGYISAPLYQQVIDCFRETYNIHIEVTYHITEKYEVNYKYLVIKNPISGIESYENAYYISYEEAREQAILKTIELIKN